MGLIVDERLLMTTNTSSSSPAANLVGQRKGSSAIDLARGLLARAFVFCARPAVNRTVKICSIA